MTLILLRLKVLSGQKKVVLSLEIGRVKLFLSPTRPHSQMCIRICIVNFNNNNTNNNNNKQEGKNSKRN